MYNFPLEFKFKISTLANDFTAKDALGNTVAYVRQKMFKLKEDIVIYADESKSNIDFRIKADRWLDFSAAYVFFDANEFEIGRVTRKGLRSILKAHYEIYDESKNIQYHITEENPWVKVLDTLLCEVPVLGIFSGYFFNPVYIVLDESQNVVAKLSKIPSFFGRSFKVEKLMDLGNSEKRVLLGLMMMILLERRRG